MFISYLLISVVLALFSLICFISCLLISVVRALFSLICFRIIFFFAPLSSPKLDGNNRLLESSSCRRVRLMAIIDQHCFIENQKIAPGGVKSEYDFLYVPIDFR